ncbi:MAG: TRAP transporter permease [Alphaproteobacteria bacterium]|nr:TRAP transporter permease [Alphaproteobacteria bacterium]
MSNPAIDTPAPPAEEFSGAKRRLVGWEAQLLYVACVVFAAFHLFVLNIRPIDAILFRAIHLGAGSAIGFALVAYGAKARRDRIAWYDWLLMAASLACAVYIWINLEALQFRAGALFTTGDLIVGLVGTILVLEFARRTAGLAIAIIAGIFIVYAFIGPWLPGVLYHRGYSFGRFFSYIFSDLGIFGITLEVSSTFIILFVAFGAFLQRSGAGDYFNNLSVALVGWARGGPAKVAVLSGALFGTISGSSVANVVASGSVTIPMMRRVGYDGATAAAVEATSSTGGQITPPVMGAGAFIMAEILGRPYSDIAYAAIIPCFLFYVACYAHCDLHAVKNGLRGVPRAELPRLRPMMVRLFMLIPVAILVWAFISGYSAFRAAAYGMIAALVVSWLVREYRMGWRAVLDALDGTTRECVQLIAVCAAAGIIVGVIALTGIGGRFAFLMLQLAGESKLLAMIFTMVIAIALGMGMPTTAAYAVAASVLAPGLIKLGVPPLVAHMFIFYYAVMSAITPPVAIASWAAASMARADPWETSWIAVKMGLATLIVPFMFFYSPVLLGEGDLWTVGVATLTAAVGVVTLAAATEGWLNGPLAMPLRAILLLASLALMLPETITDVVGGGFAVGIWMWQRYRHGANPGEAVPSAVNPARS